MGPVAVVRVGWGPDRAEIAEVFTLASRPQIDWNRREDREYKAWCILGNVNGSM